jgi:predicted nucleic acid-binding Zn ribbon protein
MTVKNCLACERPIKGRTDKKFCDDSCRNNYNNRLNSDTTPLMRNINNILRKNRRILDELLLRQEKKVLIIDRQKLAEKGYQFDYFTEHYTTKENEQYYYCYDYGYRIIDNEKVMVVKDTRKKVFPWEKKQRLVRSGE